MAHTSRETGGEDVFPGRRNLRVPVSCGHWNHIPQAQWLKNNQKSVLSFRGREARRSLAGSRQGISVGSLKYRNYRTWFSRDQQT